jgi:hypothetical protein
MGKLAGTSRSKHEELNLDLKQNHQNGDQKRLQRKHQTLLPRGRKRERDKAVFPSIAFFLLAILGTF